MFVKHYQLRATETSGLALCDALRHLAQTVVAVEGALSVDVYQDVDERKRFILVERWLSEASYVNASQQIDKSVFKAVLAQLDAPPEQATLARL